MVTIASAMLHSYYPNYLWSDEKRVPLDNEPPVPGHASLPKGSDPNDPRSYGVFKGKEYASDRINDEALKFVRKNKDKPFFLYYPTLIPHVRFASRMRTSSPTWPKMERSSFQPPSGLWLYPHFTPRAAYAAMITRMDTLTLAGCSIWSRNSA